VKTGVRQPGKVEITEGLELDDTVVTAGQQRLQKDGTPVRVIDLAAGGKGPNKDAAAAAPAAAASVPASGPATSSPAKVAPVQAEKPTPAKPTPAVPAVVSGPNPCLRG
jgi:membrane fusion protein (multidrug efflux system)